MNKFQMLAGVMLAGVGASVFGLAPVVTAHAQAAAQAVAKSYVVYIGTYTTEGSKGIYGYRFTPATGNLAPLGLIQEAANPSWLTQHPTLNVVYAANEHPTKTLPGDTVSAYARDPKTGKLTLLNAVPSKGEGPAHITVDKTGKVMVAANFISGSIASFRIQPDGKLSDVVSVFVQEGKAAGPAVAKDERGVSPTDSHNHCAMISPDNRFVLGCNIGMGKIFVFRLNTETGALEPSGEFDVPATTGERARPRHMAFHPNGKYAYIFDSSMAVVVAAYDATGGTFKAIQSLPVTTGDAAKTSMSGSEIEVDRAGKFVYTSSRAVDATLKSSHLDGTLNVFAVDATTGKLTPVQHISSGGDGPRTFALDPSGGYIFVGNRNSNTVAIFSVDRKTGKLTPTGKVLTDVPESSSFLFVAEK
jgi:6-phosphogluconolactonase